MKTFEDLLQDLQDLQSEINYLKYKNYSLNNQSEMLHLKYLASDVMNLINLHYEEQFNKL